MIGLVTLAEIPMAGVGVGGRGGNGNVDNRVTAARTSDGGRALVLEPRCEGKRRVRYG